MEVLDAYNQIAEERGDLPNMKRGGCEAAADRYDDPDSLWAALQALDPQQGWLQFQSRQFAFTDGPPDPETDWGLLLAAEAVCADGSSVAISLDGSGGWRFTSYRHNDHGDYLYDEPAQLAYDPKLGRLCYRRYWRHDPDQGYVQERACFIGFDEGAK